MASPHWKGREAVSRTQEIESLAEIIATLTRWQPQHTARLPKLESCPSQPGQQTCILVQTQ